MPPFLFEVAVDAVLEGALEHREQADVELLHLGQLLVLEYANDIALVCDSIRAAQNILCRLETSARKSGMIGKAVNV